MAKRNSCINNICFIFAWVYVCSLLIEHVSCLEVSSRWLIKSQFTLISVWISSYIHSRLFLAVYAERHPTHFFNICFEPFYFKNVPILVDECPHESMCWHMPASASAYKKMFDCNWNPIWVWGTEIKWQNYSVEYRYSAKILI